MNSIDTMVIAALAEHLGENGISPEEVLEAADMPAELLLKEGSLISNELFIILFAQARRLLGDDMTAREVGRRLADKIIAGQGSARLTPEPSPKEIGDLVAGAVKQLFVSFSARPIRVSKTELKIVIAPRQEYLHTVDHCRIVEGLMERMAELSGVTVMGLSHDKCMVPVDRVGEFGGKFFRIDDRGIVWQYESAEGAQSREPVPAGQLAEDQSHEIGSRVYGAGCCELAMKWIDTRSEAARAWDKTGGRILRLAEAIRMLEAAAVEDQQFYRRIAERWQGVIKWEKSWDLTRSKYFAYVVTILAALAAAAIGLAPLALGYPAPWWMPPALAAAVTGAGFYGVGIQVRQSRALMAQREDARQCLQNAGAGVTIIRPDFTIEYANPLLQEIHNRVTGRKCYEALRWEEEPCQQCPVSDVLAGRPHAQAEVQYLDKNGRTRWYAINSTPILANDETVTSVINVTTDITDRKQLELELSRKKAEMEASESRYRSFMANAADAILITDTSHNIIELNKKGAALMESGSSGAVKGANFFETAVIHPEERSRIEKLFRDMIRDRAPRSFETRFKGSDGHVTHIEARAIPILMDGRVEWVQCIFRDVTDRVEREFEKTLLLSISNAIKDAPDLEAMVGKALEGICAVMSVPIGAIFLRHPERKQLELVSHVGLTPQAVQRMAKVAIDGSASDVASRSAILKRTIVINDVANIKVADATRKRLQRYSIESMASVPMLMDSQIKGVIYIASRHSHYFDPRRLAVINQVANELAVGVDKQRLHDVIRNKNRELVEKNEELESATLQLLQSEKMASIGQLAAGVAHEINNPIGYVNSNLNLLESYRKDLMEAIDHYRALLTRIEEGCGPEEIPVLVAESRKMEEQVDLETIVKDIKDMIAESVEGVERVTYIVRNLKEFSHPETGVEREVDVHECLENTLNIVWNEIKYKAEVKKDYGEVPVVKLNGQELKQVFLNLLVNASQAIEGRGEIGITTYVEEDEVKIAISDTGIGISPDKLRKIFDPFFTTKEVGKGTGLGLSISYSIITKYGGRIEVDSEPGKGTTFTVVLPAAGKASEKDAECAGDRQRGAQSMEVEHDETDIKLANG